MNCVTVHWAISHNFVANAIVELACRVLFFCITHRMSSGMHLVSGVMYLTWCMLIVR